MLNYQRVVIHTMLIEMLPMGKAMVLGTRNELALHHLEFQRCQRRVFSLALLRGLHELSVILLPSAIGLMSAEARLQHVQGIAYGFIEAGGIYTPPPGCSCRRLERSFNL